MMVSVVIRNKNEADALKVVLSVLTKMYAHDIDDIVVVDNHSTDNSLNIAKQYNCNIITISDFTYGKATNLGIKHAKNNYVLMLSAHAMPIGASFFKTSIKILQENPKVAGLRYINSPKNYLRALDNDFLVVNGLSHGLMTACAMVNKTVWYDHKFDETLVFSEDKHWSDSVIKSGYMIKDVNETFFYFAKRSLESQVKRWKLETLADYQLKAKSYPSYGKIFATYVYNITFKNVRQVIGFMVKETKKLGASLQNKRILNSKNKKHTI